MMMILSRMVLLTLMVVILPTVVRAKAKLITQKMQLVVREITILMVVVMMTVY